MEFLTQQNRRIAGDLIADKDAILATGKRVVILGGGDTGSDCLGTSLRQQAAEVTQIELLPKPPAQRAPSNPWPEWPNVLRTSSSQQEGGNRLWSLMTTGLLGDDEGRIRALQAVQVTMDSGKPEPVSGTEIEVPCELLLLAMGFVGSARTGLLEQLAVEMDGRNNVATTDWQTSVPGVFATGDQARGQSLVVWAISDGRKCAGAVDRFLSARRSLPIVSAGGA
jgi:glutamate synthase (NADPH/NADH) small chain